MPELKLSVGITNLEFTPEAFCVETNTLFPVMSYNSKLTRQSVPQE